MNMIQILNKYNCCGCSACMQICPKQCISMYEDEEGFLYPKVYAENCINCHLCEKACPCLNLEQSKEPIICYAARNIDDGIRRQSSSGGIFSAIAEKIVAEGGVVFGARFDSTWQVIHASVETKNDIEVFRGSKYVQSKIGDAFIRVETFLKEGRVVLFSGTPCQVSGLNHFLRREYDNLLTVEIVCHGVPSPKIWREYIESLKVSSIGSISHKDKSTGWRGYSFLIKDTAGKVIYAEKASDNKYLMAFIRNLTLRPACFSCPAKAGKSGADITLGDYWGIEYLIPKMDDNSGTSFIRVGTQKGKAIINELNLHIEQADYNRSVPYNPCIEESTSEPEERKKFWENYKKQGINALLSLKKQNIFKQIIKRIVL